MSRKFPKPETNPTLVASHTQVIPNWLQLIPTKKDELPLWRRTPFFQRISQAVAKLIIIDFIPSVQHLLIAFLFRAVERATTTIALLFTAFNSDHPIATSSSPSSSSVLGLNPDLSVRDQNRACVSRYSLVKAYVRIRINWPHWIRLRLFLRPSSFIALFVSSALASVSGWRGVVTVVWVARWKANSLQCGRWKLDCCSGHGCQAWYDGILFRQAR